MGEGTTSAICHVVPPDRSLKNPSWAKQRAGTYGMHSCDGGVWASVEIQTAECKCHVRGAVMAGWLASFLFGVGKIIVLRKFKAGR